TTSSHYTLSLHDALPIFHPQLSGRENIFLNASILGIPQKVIARRLDDIISFADIGEFIDSPVKIYSSGMKVRLGFSVAVHVEPRSEEHTSELQSQSNLVC